jgi:hypothetical protein
MCGRLGHGEFERMIVPRTYGGWYKIWSDCTGRVALLDSLGSAPINTKAIVLRGGEGIHPERRRAVRHGFYSE